MPQPGRAARAGQLRAASTAPRQDGSTDSPHRRPAPEDRAPPTQQEVIDAFIRSERLAVEAGFDGVMLYGGHGYLLASFVSITRRLDQAVQRRGLPGPGATTAR